MNIEFNVAEALDKLDMMSFEEAQEWIAELDKEEARALVEYLMKKIRIDTASGADLDLLTTIPTFPEVEGESVEDRRTRYKQSCDDVLLTRGKSSNGKVVEMRNGSCKEWLDELIQRKD